MTTKKIMVAIEIVSCCWHICLSISRFNSIDGPGGKLNFGNLITHDDTYNAVGGGDNEFEDDNSDTEDLQIKPTDNLILVGHVEGDASILEVYGEFMLT